MVLDNIRQSPFNTTLMGVVKGVLDHFGMPMSNAMAFAGSGHAFLINIHEQICPSGPYCWKYDGFYRLLANLGLEMTDLGFFHASSTAEERARVEGQVRSATQGRCVVRAAEAPNDPKADVPVLLRHPPWLQPFAPLLTGYGLPRYREVEPTLFVASGYLLMFGMMFGDVGHGAVLVAAAVAFRKKLGRFTLFGHMME